MISNHLTLRRRAAPSRRVGNSRDVCPTLRDAALCAAPQGEAVFERAWSPAVPLLRHPERVRLVAADVSARIPGVIAFLGHVLDLRADHDRLADAVHRADGEDLVGAGGQDLLPRLAPLV